MERLHELRIQARGVAVSKRDAVQKSLYDIFRQWHGCAMGTRRNPLHPEDAARGIKEGDLCDDCNAQIEAHLKDIFASHEPEHGEGWISVKDRLPNNHQHCLIWLDGAALPCIGTLNRRHAHSLGSELIYYFALGNAAGDRQLDEVTHWMPLPSEPFATHSDGKS